MEGPEILIPIVVPTVMFLTIFGIVYLYKRERMAMIERGMDPRRYKAQSAPFQNLKWGLLLIGAGLGLFIAYLLDRTAFANDSDNEAIYFGLIAVFGGLGLFASYLIEKKETMPRKDDYKIEE
ncbi:DUF6249 domain-containing protein [Mucilaginibacter jinjuensis]|uniref:DUF6249 domain-containing protein n=1 Tax=Mucilaginibacter jinjuensis TaxID=1176721 RepID=A0ABY7T6M7_9SPHI|nr:DUF6249 domain-containing protein [Mucilaginibacter jinjuensis]WCT12140.1 hypothetical protein PQO05_25775 [Mucilaginibacter jinjuensis]